jgi:diguanylate cyclase (GGDEF)-like protein
MSFRARLTRFFILIVVIPMIAVAFLVFRLISESQQAKTDARANGVLSAAASLYRSESITASAEARSVAHALSSQVAGKGLSGAQLRGVIAALRAQSGLARVAVRIGSKATIDIGDPTALAPGSASVRGRQITVVASELTASQYVRELAGTVRGVALLVHEGGRVVGETGLNPPAQSLPTHGSVTVNHAAYRALTQPFRGFDGAPVQVTVLASVSQAGRSFAGSRLVALAFIVGFLLLALSFSIWASRGLHVQVSRFLHAARRLAGGDFSSPIRIEGRDEFAALGEEFNNMSSQLAQRLDELSQERVRLREAIRRIGQTFASNLDRPALLELALKTAIDAVRAMGGRVTTRSATGHTLEEAIREGSVNEARPAIMIAERVALETGDCGDGADHDWHAVSVPMGPLESGGRVHGLITVVREGEPFTYADRDLLRSLASQATLALENVDLHLQVSRQAITDDLTGLANHGRFQELLGIEIEQVRRYHHPLGLIMLDIDDFKSINDTYGHQQGDLVLKRVARVLEDSSREVDYPARYGGEELAVILPHTDLEGAHAIAERIRVAIESLRVPRIDNQGMLRITASLGVATSNDGEKDALIAEADAALYEAKRQGKNRTVQAPVEAANVFSAE